MARQVESAVFVDLESAAGGNLGPRSFNTKKLIELIEEDFDAKIRIANAYADFRHHGRYIEKLHLTGMEAVQVTGYEAGKQSVDMRICCDALITAYEQPNIVRFIILANDTDYVPLVRVLRKMGKSVYLLCKKDRDYIEAAYATFCDRIVDYAHLLAVRAGSEESDQRSAAEIQQGHSRRVRKSGTSKPAKKRTAAAVAPVDEVAPLVADEPEQLAPEATAGSVTLQKAQSALLELLEEQGGPLLGAQVLPRLRRKLGLTFDFSDVGYGSAKAFLLSFPSGEVTVEQEGLADLKVVRATATDAELSVEAQLTWIIHNVRLVSDYHFSRDAERRTARLDLCHRAALATEPFTRTELVVAICAGADDITRGEANDYFSVLSQSGCLVKLPNGTPSRFVLADDVRELSGLTRRYESSIVYKSLAFLERVGRLDDWSAELQCRLFGRQVALDRDEEVLRTALALLEHRRANSRQDGSETAS